MTKNGESVMYLEVYDPRDPNHHQSQGIYYYYLSSLEAILMPIGK